MSKKLLSECDLYKCKDCKHYIVAEFKRGGKKPLIMGRCDIRNSNRDKLNCREPSQYACKKFVLAEMQKAGGKHESKV